MTHVEKKTQVAFLGPPASYTHQAASDLFPTEDHELLQQRTIPEVFKAVQSSLTELGVVPFENSSNGPVDVTLDCLIDRKVEFQDIRVSSETYISVSHCLLGRRNDFSTPPLGSSKGNTLLSQSTPNLGHIKDLYSHPQAFGQCRSFLADNLKSVEQHEVASTSEAASIVAKTRDNHPAAISSELAATVYGLDVLAAGIQDQKDNSTRFLVLTRREDPISSDQPDSRAKWKALLAFTINHQAPGSLAQALDVFKQHNLNLTSINSRPSRQRPWHYIFLVEFEVTATSPVSQRQIEGALKALDLVAEWCKCLGYWNA